MMSLTQEGSTVAVAGAGTTPGRASEPHHQLKSRIKKHLLDKFYLAAVDSLTTDRMRAEIVKTVEQLANEERTLTSESERQALIRAIQHECSVSQQSLAESPSLRSPP